MPTARHSVIVAAPAGAVWARLADVASWPRWLRAPYASESVTVANSPVGVGTEFVLKGSLPFRLFASVTEWREEQLLSFQIYRSEYPSDRLFFERAVITIELDRLDETRTRATGIHRVAGKGLLGTLYMATVFRPFLMSNVRRFVRSLREAALDL